MTQKTFLYLSANHPRCKFISRRMRASPGTATLALALTYYTFMNRSEQRGSRTGLRWDLLRLERTDHDWQPPWRFHGEALLPVRMTWEQRGRDRSLAVLVSAQLLVPSLAHSPLFSCNFLWQWNGETHVFWE